MWGFFNCTHYLHRAGQTNVILMDASFAADSLDKVAIFAPPGRGKTTLVRLLTGMDRPRAGSILQPHDAWPLGYAGGFRAEMTGEQNIRGLARIAGISPDDLSAFVYDLTGLGDAFFLPVAYYTNRMKSRLGFAASFGIPARLMIADDKLISSDPEFREKYEAELHRRLNSAGLIFLASNPRPAEEVCDRFVVLHRARFEEHDTYRSAADRLEEIMAYQDMEPAEPDDDTNGQDRASEDLLYFDLV
ncbi:MAG: hypothetical protein R3E21_10155 [Caenibius sp.]